MNHDFDVISAARNWRLDNMARQVPTDIAKDVYAKDVLGTEELRQRLSRRVLEVFASHHGKEHSS